eukprot:CAMPEP_0118892382 /NCGR_PEP_ID=MMETSP1166-20130328/2007_1 /TAXON_ID=1104430 /ORGANISM="Chrysoreinhardia sp, Strain CCMP3193" /LENGTH=78 /DNA_ID=CAMNT_0006831101 /DNA_START=12 /DNA_END=245 /DNA_ORIENTATION=+
MARRPLLISLTRPAAFPSRARPQPLRPLRLLRERYPGGNVEVEDELGTVALDGREVAGDAIPLVGKLQIITLIGMLES